MTARASRPGPDEIQITLVDVTAWPASSTQVADALALLAPGEHERYERFRHDIDRHMFLAGRAMARRLVGAALGCGPMEWTWREGVRGRPEIADPGETLQFNLAHSGGLVVCALTDGRPVGVDVEALSRRMPDPLIVDRYCAPVEIADIRAQEDAWLPRFLLYWTLKESYLKALGLGIGVRLQDIAFDLTAPDEPRITFGGSLAGTDDRWVFRVLQPTPSHLVAVATTAPDGAPPAVTLRTLEPPLG